MRRLKRTILLVGLAIPLTGAFVSFNVGTARAESTSSTLLSVDLLSVDSASLAPEEKLAKAKEDLVRALDLSLKKVESLKSRLNELNFPEDSREQALKNGALGNLDTYAEYYLNAKENLDKKGSLDEVKDLAKEIKEYRDTTYTPGVERTVRFILVFYNEEVLGVANDRFSKIGADIKKLDKLGVVSEGDFREKLDEVTSLLKEAADLQGEAKKIILATSTDPGKSEEPSAKDMIEKSLNNVKTVYGIFLELNQLVKEALGI